ncbi:hypothetical protein C8J56DRAFT_1053207 [Mycena floridula]|nr:hypothetical protein C8J56DRAFT_1053207 [Mycena floridula]
MTSSSSRDRLMPPPLTHEKWLDMIREGDENAFPFLKLNTIQVQMLQSLVPRILNLEVNEDEEGLALHLKEFKLAWLAQFPVPAAGLERGRSLGPLTMEDVKDVQEAYWTTIQRRLAEEIQMWPTRVPFRLGQDILDEDRKMLEVFRRQELSG